VEPALLSRSCFCQSSTYNVLSLVLVLYFYSYHHLQPLQPYSTLRSMDIISYRQWSATAVDAPNTTAALTASSIAPRLASCGHDTSEALSARYS
jgi:hypothetical protein